MKRRKVRAAWIDLSNHNHNLETSKAPLESQVQGNSLVTSTGWQKLGKHIPHSGPFAKQGGQFCCALGPGLLIYMAHPVGSVRAMSDPPIRRTGIAMLHYFYLLTCSPCTGQWSL